MSAGELMGHDDADPDDDGLASLRAAFRSMPDEEPPARGLAELMAAARAKADEMAPAPEPWWQRALAMLRRPQVLALATIVLVAGGAVLIGRHRADMEAPAPAVQAPAAEPEVQRNEAPVPAPATTPPPASPVEVAPEASSVAPPPPPAKAARPERPKSAQKAGGAGGDVGGPAKQPKPADTRMTLDQDAAEGEAAQAPLASDAIEQTPTLEQLHAQARAAAAAGDCATAKKLVAQIQRRDAGYYKAKVATDASLAACK